MEKLLKVQLKAAFGKALERSLLDSTIIEMAKKENKDTFNELFPIKLQLLVLDFMMEGSYLREFYMENAGIVEENTRNCMVIMLKKISEGDL